MADISKVTGLTAAEQDVMDKLMVAYGAMLELPREHPDELRDFVDGIHRCQDVLAVRIVRRCFPLGWPTHSVQPQTATR